MPDRLSAQGLARFGEVATSHIGDDTVPGMAALVAAGDQVHRCTSWRWARFFGAPQLLQVPPTCRPRSRRRGWANCFRR